MYKGLRCVDTLPLHIVLDMFESIVSVYGSGVWGYKEKAQSETNKISSDLQDQFCEPNQPRVISSPLVNVA